MNAFTDILMKVYSGFREKYTFNQDVWNILFLGAEPKTCVTLITKWIFTFISSVISINSIVIMCYFNALSVDVDWMCYYM